MARLIRHNGTVSIELGKSDKAVRLGINSEKFFNRIVASGEPLIDVPSVSGTQIGIIEEGLTIDAE
jgi:hypothetical protein